MGRGGPRPIFGPPAWLAATAFGPDLVLCSSATRAREALGFLREPLGDPEVLYERALYLAPAKRLFEHLQKLPATTRSVLLIGHNPGLCKFTLELMADRAPEARARFKISAKNWHGLNPKTARLLDFIVRRDLEPR